MNEKKTWEDGPYIRTLLDGREKWATVLSLTAVAGLFVLLWDRLQYPHNNLSFVPFIVGLIGTVYLFVVACYYEEAEELYKSQKQAESLFSWFGFRDKIGVLGRVNIQVLQGITADIVR